MRDQIIDSLTNSNKKFYFITGDLGFKTFDKLKKKIHQRFINIGVAEQNMINVATGLSVHNEPVITYSIVNFATFRCLEQIRNSICYDNLNIKIISNGAGYSYGALGFTHHGIEDIGIIKILPNIKILTPTFSHQLGQIKKFLLNVNCPIYLRLDNKFLKKKRNINYKIHKNTKNIFVSHGTLVDIIENIIEKKNIAKTSSVITPLCIDEFENIIKKNIKKNKRYNFFIFEEHKNDFGLISEYYKILKNYKNINVYIQGIENKNLHTVGDRDFLRRISKLDFDSLFDFVSKNI